MSFQAEQVVAVQLRISINLKALTIEEMVGKRKRFQVVNGQVSSIHYYSRCFYCHLKVKLDMIFRYIKNLLHTRCINDRPGFNLHFARLHIIPGGDGRKSYQRDQLRSTGVWRRE